MPNKTYQVILINGLWKNSPVPLRSIGVYKLAHSLRKQGVTVKVIDFVDGLTGREIYKLFDAIQTKETRWVGFGSSFVSQIVKREFVDADGKKKQSKIFKKARIPVTIFNFFMSVKKHAPHVKTIVGGVKADVLDPDDYECFDYAFSGYSEDVAWRLHSFLSRGEGTPEIKELAHGCKLLKFPTPVFRMPRDTPYDIVRDDFTWHDDDHIQTNETLPLETARGCIFRCKFCSYPELGKKKGQYVRDMELVEKELLDNWNRWGITNYLILDDTFNDDPDKVKAFRDMSLRLPFRLQFSGYLRCDLIWATPETAVWLKEAGLKGAFFGIESMHPKASRVIGKGWNGGPHSKPFIEKLRHEIWGDDVTIFTSFILGLPGENRDSIMESVEWVKKNRIQGAAFRALTMREQTGTYVSEFEENAEKYGYNIFRDERGNDSWTNSGDYDLNSRQACSKLEIELTYEMSNMNRYTGWVLMPLATIGIDINKAMHVLETDQHFIKNFRDPLSQSWRDRYFKSIWDSIKKPSDQ